MNKNSIKSIVKVYKIKSSKIDLKISETRRDLQEKQEEIKEKEKTLSEYQLNLDNVRLSVGSYHNFQRSSESTSTGHEYTLLEKIDIIEDEIYLLEYGITKLEKTVKDLNREKMLLEHKREEIVNLF